MGHEIQISVEDEGPGIPDENLERIFERFYTDRPQENFGQNSGLGLNISRQIAVAHGGRLWAENRPRRAWGAARAMQASGRSGGARFVMRLPAT
jgi:two-component system sensor histidine kinase ChvG